jgi:hypothetical protein
VVEAKYATGVVRTFWIEPVQHYVVREVNRVRDSEEQIDMANVEWDRVPPDSAFLPRKVMQAGTLRRTPARPLNPTGYGNCTKPEQTPEATVAHLDGIAMLKMTVGTDGVPTDIQVTKPVGLGMDEQVKACAAMARYQPAQQDGVPVASQITIGMSVGGGLRSGSDWHLIRAEFFPAAGEARPVFRKADYPQRTEEPRNFTVKVRATIGGDGTPREVEGSGSGDPKIDKRAGQIVSRWRFQGTGKDVPAEFELHLGMDTNSGGRAIRSVPR